MSMDLLEKIAMNGIVLFIIAMSIGMLGEDYGVSVDFEAFIYMFTGWIAGYIHAQVDDASESIKKEKNDEDY